MKKLITLYVIFISSCTLIQRSENSNYLPKPVLSISILSNEDEEISEDQKRKSLIYVEFKNNTNDSIYLWKFDTEWGCSNLWFEGKCKISDIKLDTIMPRFCNIWDSNYPSSIMIKPNDRVIRLVNLHSGYGGWGNSPITNQRCNEYIWLKARYESGFEAEDNDEYWRNHNQQYRSNFDWRNIIWKGSINSDWKRFKINRVSDQIDSCIVDKLKGECNTSVPAFKVKRVFNVSDQGKLSIADSIKIQNDIQKLLKNLDEDKE